MKRGGGAGGHWAAFCWVSCRLKYKNSCSCIKHCQFLGFIVILHPRFTVFEGRNPSGREMQSYSELIIVRAEHLAGIKEALVRFQCISESLSSAG